MDINSRIQWTPGMVLTSGTMESLDRSISMRRLLEMRAVTGERFGLLPGREFSADGFFVKKHFEVPSLKCTALLPSGMIVDADETVSLEMTKLEDGEYYFCIGIGEGSVNFENEGVTYVRPEYVYSIMNLAELEDRDVLPLVRLGVGNGICSIDSAFIPPCLFMSGDAKLLKIRDLLMEKVSSIINHPNLVEGDGKNNLFRYLFHLRSLSRKTRVSEFLRLTREIVAVVDYFIVAPGENGSRMEIPEVSYNDVERWLGWTADFLDSAVGVLDGTELQKSGIDIEALKEEIRDSLSDRLKKELSESLRTELRPLLDEDTDARLDQLLKGYVDGSIRRDMHDSIKGEVSDELDASLYDKLYRALYDALFVPSDDEEKEYMPLI